MFGGQYSRLRLHCRKGGKLGSVLIRTLPQVGRARNTHASRRFKAASSITFTPNSTALSNFEPASAPATT